MSRRLLLLDELGAARVKIQKRVLNARQGTQAAAPHLRLLIAPAVTSGERDSEEQGPELIDSAYAWRKPRLSRAMVHRGGARGARARS